MQIKCNHFSSASPFQKDCSIKERSVVDGRKVFDGFVGCNIKNPSTQAVGLAFFFFSAFSFIFPFFYFFSLPFSPPSTPTPLFPPNTVVFCVVLF